MAYTRDWELVSEFAFEVDGAFTYPAGNAASRKCAACDFVIAMVADPFDGASAPPGTLAEAKLAAARVKGILS